MTDESREILDSVREMFGMLSSKIENLESTVSITNERIVKLETAFENKMDKNIQLLAEGFSVLTEKSEKLDNVPDKLNAMQSDLSIIKQVVTGHSIEINKLTRAK